MTDATQTINRRDPKPWQVVLAAACVMAGMVGLVANCVGILFAAVIQDLNFSTGSLSVYYTIKNITAALSLAFTARMVLTKNCRAAMTFLAACAGVSFAAMYFFTSLWQWYLSAAICGIGTGCIFTVVPIILNNWFRKNNGAIIGLVMSGSGLAGMVFSPIISWVILQIGWRGTAIFMGAATFLLVALPSIFFLKPAPEGETVSFDGKKSAGKTDDPHAEHRPMWVFLLCLMCVLFPQIIIGFANQLTVFAIGTGYSLMVGGTMTSLAMAGNVGGKFGLGALADKLGIFRGMWIVTALGILSMLLFIGAGSGVVLAYGGSLLFGFLYSLYSTGPALFLLQIYGREEYPRQLSRMQAINTFITAFASSAMAFVYDIFGNFIPLFLIFLVMLALILLFTITLKRRYRLR